MQLNCQDFVLNCVQTMPNLPHTIGKIFVLLVMFNNPGELNRGSLGKNRNKLKYLLRKFSQNTKVINLRSRGIDDVLLNDTFINFPRCEKLIFFKNKISKIEVNAFRGLSLQRLVLQDNKIEVLQHGLFAEMTILEEMYLGFNRIQMLPNR